MLSVIALIAIPQVSLSDWAGPNEVISGTWGKANTQFGLERGDTVAYDQYPTLDGILGNGAIVISDQVNKRTVVYNADGSFKEKEVWVEEKISGGMVRYVHKKYLLGCCVQGYGKNGNLWTGSQDKYALTGKDGTLISTSPTRPPELGQVTEKRIGKKEYQITVKYPDKEWVITSDKSIGYGVARPFRDANGKLYLIYSKKVERYNDEGKIVGTLSMPEVQYGAVTIPPEWPDNAEPPRARVVAEYGSPVVAPSGDVYTWMRSDTHYKILKWTWQN